MSVERWNNYSDFYGDLLFMWRSLENLKNWFRFGWLGGIGIERERDIERGKIGNLKGE